MSRLDLTWLSKLNVGDSVIFSHSIINPKGRRHRVVAVHKRWLTLDNKVRVSLVTGDVIQGRNGPQCESVYPWPS